MLQRESGEEPKVFMKAASRDQVSDDDVLPKIMKSFRLLFLIIAEAKLVTCL
jgi:hypothetical protein